MINVSAKVKDLLRQGSCKKRYRFIVEKETILSEQFTIDNNNIVSESVSIVEKLCSSDELKFGLCEGSSLEFQYFGFPSIKGRLIHAYIDIEIGKRSFSPGHEEPIYEPIPLGWFRCMEISRQASTGIYKATCYDKLMSDYLDADATEDISNIIKEGEYGYTNQVSVYTLIKKLLEGYGIEEDIYNATELSFDGPKSCNITTIPLCYSDGTPYGANLYLYMYEISMKLEENEFYYFDLFTRNLLGFAKENIWSRYKDEYTKVNGTVYTIERYASTSYRDAWDLCGEISCRKNADINTFFFDRKGGASDYTTDTYSKCWSIGVNIPVYATTGTREPSIIPTTWDYYFRETWGINYKFFSVYKKELSDIQKVRLDSNFINNNSKVTLRELQSSVFELNAQFGKLDRETDLFSGISLGQERLFPSNGLHPSETLYPGGTAERANKSMYSKLWADKGNVRTFRNLEIHYKTLDEQQKETEDVFIYYVNSNGTDDYIMDDNWLLKNLIWTKDQIRKYGLDMTFAMRNISWFPFEMWCPALPYLETGDEIEISIDDEVYTSYILQRTMSGIQRLEDTYINGHLDIF